MTDTAPQPVPGAIDDLASVLASAEGLLDGIDPDRASDPTPCTGLDVAHLVDHVLGWSAVYAARLSGSEPGDPHDYVAGDDPGAELRASAAQILAGYREGSPGAQQLPIGVVLMDYLGHGWDLAVATGQSVRFPDSAVERALGTGRQMLTPETRGDSFGPEISAPAGATALEQLVAFLGRDPHWSPRRRT